MREQAGAHRQHTSHLLLSVALSAIMDVVIYRN